MEHKINVDKNNRMSVVFQELNKMREDPERCDFRILVGSEKILAHRNILSANSKYFEAMFTHNTKEKQSGEVTLKEVDQVCVKKCVDYMYSFEISSSYEKLGDLLHVATMMQLHEVCDGIIELLEENLDSESYCVTKKLSSMFSLKSLEEKCDEFVLENFEEISKLDDFNGLGQMEVAKMIESMKLKASEEVKLTALLSWIKFDSDDRSKYANNLIGLVELSKVSLGYRRHLIENEPMIRENNKCLAWFSISVMDSVKIKPTKVVEQTANTEAIVVFDRNSDHLQCFNPTDKSWTQMQEMNQEIKRYFFSAVTAGDFIYVLMKDKKVYKIQYLDKDANWEKMTDMLEDHGRCPPAVVYKNWIYVIGGHAWRETATVEKYDLDLNVWTKCHDKLQPTKWSEVVSFQDKIYSFGGFSTGQWIDAVDQLDPETGNWTTIGHMNNARGYVSAVELGEEIYVLGGFTDKHQHFHTAEQYTTHEDKWKSLQSMLIPRSWFRTFAIQGDIFAVGGYNSSPGSLEKYNIDESKWEMIKIPKGVKLKIKESVKIQLNCFVGKFSLILFYKLYKMEHKINIDKNNRMSVVFQELNKMRKDPERCDFKILVGSEKILAHRNILSANSKYFEAMLTHNTKEKQSGEVTLVEVDQVCVKKCVDYMYSFEISSSYEKLGDLLHVATMMQLHEICDGIIELLEENLDPKSYFVTKKLSIMYNLKSLEEKSDEFAIENFEEISKLKDFNDLGQMEVAKMIESEKLKASEEVKLRSVLSWIKFDSDDRSKYANDLIRLVELFKVSLGCRRHLIENEPIINKSFDLLSRFSISVMDSLNVKPIKLMETATNAEAIVVFDRNTGHLQCLNPTDKCWTQMQEMNQEMKNGFFSAVTSGDFIYVLMEDKSVYRMNYSDKDANWEKMTDMLESHGSNPPAVIYKNWIYVIGGYNGCETATVEKYNLNLNVWVKCHDKLQPTKWSEVIAYQNKIYSFGGCSSDRYIDAVDQLDLETGNWTTIGHMTNARGYVSPVALGEKIYALGGFTDKHQYFNTAEQYNPNENKWKSLQSMLIPRSRFRTFAIQGEVYAVGGYSSSPGSLETYDIAENKWEMIEIPEGVKLNIKEAVKIQLKN
uniref:uncharacterized protein LOC120340389 n=1 Tax=Styela clava TaxID=7725 RepID=UPI0019399C0E|nr:uncharacterized protein LOC120340389 [Styela clava]